jgi:hypothetical protein
MPRLSLVRRNQDRFENNFHQIGGACLTDCTISSGSVKGNFETMTESGVPSGRRKVILFGDF